MSTRDRQNGPAHSASDTKRRDASTEAEPSSVSVDSIQALQMAGGNQAMVQLHGGGGTEGVHAAAAHGISGGGGAMPHADTIQQAFGGHDISGVQAHVGGKAAEGSKAMGAEAYATGNDVAFASTPSLHTAAHEAAHVIQQQAGVSLSGGVGQVGDSYEKHADSVADAVVSGKSAAPILDQMTGGKRSGGGEVQGKAIQRLAGDVENTPVRQDMGGDGTTTVADAAQEAHPGERDASFNPARKVEFEAALAQLILSNPDSCSGTVHAVSRNILAYIRQQEEEGLAITRIELMRMVVGDSAYFGRLFDEALTNGPEAKINAVETMLSDGGGAISQHLMAHGKFMWNIYERDWKETVRRNFLIRFSKHRDLEAQDPRAIREDTIAFGSDGSAAVDLFEGANRGRLRPGEPGSATSSSPEVASQGASGIRSTQGGDTVAPLDTSGMGADEARATSASHGRGTEKWTVDEAQRFSQQARIDLNMPLSGGGPSGTTADLLTVACAMGAGSAEQKLEYAIACMGVLGAAGAHSFHEIMTIARTIGVEYNPGSYEGVYPAHFQARVDALKSRFADIFPDGRTVATPGTSTGGGGA